MPGDVTGQARKAKSQRRTVTVNVRPYHEALQEARAPRQTPDFKKQYQARAGIEGTISQGVRVTKMIVTTSSPRSKI